MDKQTKPLVFIDLETTGTDIRESKIVQLAAVKVWHYKRDADTVARLVNPGVPIPKEATEIHGITNDMVKDEATFKELAPEIIELVNDCNIAGFNSNRFDVPLLYNEFKRAGITWDWKKSKFVDVCNIFKIKEPRTLEAAYKFYTGETLEGAHDALTDVKATVSVLRHQLSRYELTNTPIDELALFSNFDKEIVDITGHFTKDAEGFLIFNFGKWKGERAKDQFSYLDWMLRGDFDEEVKDIARNVRYKGWK